MSFSAPSFKATVLIPFAPQYVLEKAEDRIVVDLPEGFLDVDEKRVEEER
jgi:hypothetical protein